MKNAVIERNGAKIELTPEEMWEIYWAVEHKKDVEKIKRNIEKDLAENQEFLNCAAEYLRSYLNMDQEESIESAIEDAKKELGL